MGNWIRVNVVGTCDEDDVPALAEKLKFDVNDDTTMDNFGPLVCGGICGLPPWAAVTFNVIGNLAERDYDAHGVAKHLEQLADAAPSLRCKVHVGSDYEADECIATVTLEGGKATVGRNEIETIAEINQSQAMGNLMAQLMRKPGQR